MKNDNSGLSKGRAILIAVFIALGFAVQATAQQSVPVTLKSVDGTISITGQLISYENNTYVIDAEGIGRLKIENANVICTGIVCPALKSDFGPEFGIHGSRTIGTTLIPNLLRGYAASTDATYEIAPTDDPAKHTVTLRETDGSVRAVIDLQTRGSGSAFPALADGKAAIGVADRSMKDSDALRLASSGIGELRDTPNEIVLGVDGIVLITHKENPIRNLSSEDVARIWSGEVTNWLEFGGGNVPITINSFDEGSGDRAVLLDGLVRPLGKDETASVTRWSNYQDMVDAVMADRGGIGYVGRWLAASNDVNQLAIREVCGLLSPPTDFRMKIEGYSLSRRLYAYTKPGMIHPVAAEFLQWAASPEAQPYVEESHFIGNKLERMRLEDMGMMLIHTAAVEPDFSGHQYSDMMAQLRGADRLSMSFRFETGSAFLDQTSLAYIDDLAARMEKGEFDGHEVLLVGFADSVGNRGRNTSLARYRATAVETILRQKLTPETASRMNLIPLSFGELLPLSCNDDEVGRSRNRRVEVWLRLPNTRITLR